MVDTLPSDSDTLESLSQDELDEIARKHEMFLKGIKGGARAIIKFKNLNGLDLSQRDFSQGDFTGSFFVRANLAQGVFKSAIFFACDMRDADLKEADFSRADLRGAYVAGADMTDANLEGADLREGKIMEKGKAGILQDRPLENRKGGNKKIHTTVFAGAKMAGTNLSGARATAADFSDADLQGVNIKDAELNRVNLRGANLADSDMSGSTLEHANVQGAILTGSLMKSVELAGTNMKEALTEENAGSDFEKIAHTLENRLKEHTKWIDSTGMQGEQLDLSGYDMRHVLGLKEYCLTAIKAIKANFLKQDLSDMEMQSAILDLADFRDCKMVGIDLRGSSMKDSFLTRADLSHADLGPLQFTDDNDGSTWLRRTNLSGSNLRYATLMGVDLREAIMMGVDLSYAVLINCDLRRADLTGALLDGVDLSGSLLSGAIIDEKYQ